VLVSAAGITVRNLRRRPVQTWGRVAAALGTYGAANTRAVVVRPRLRHLALVTIARHPSRLRADLCWEQIRSSGTPGFMDALDALIDYDFRDRLGEISCPTLLVWGTEDMLVPVKDADEFERRIPNACKVLMADTGHIPMMERPVTFNDTLMAFLAEPREAPRSEAEATA
jgi:pimeloyl-ACP methyl ester carboxylesterase